MKKLTTDMTIITKAEYKRRARKAARTRKRNLLAKKSLMVKKVKRHTRKKISLREKMLHDRAIIARWKNVNSENQFVDRLKKELGPKALIFKTGTAEGVPDIVVYKEKKLSFYEVKPGEASTKKNSLLKPTQVDWIKQYCFDKKIDVYLVFYKGKRYFKYARRKIDQKNIRKYLQSTRHIDKMIKNIKNYSYK